MTAHLALVDPPVVAPVDSAQAAIEVSALSLRFGKKFALRELSLCIPAGGIHAIVGANGAGKSSLFRVLLGVQAPSSGSARILGQDCAQLSEATRARIGFVNEEHSMPPWLSVAEITRMQRHLYPQWDEPCYRHIIGHFHVLPEQKIAGLSRGERAGLNLAMALAQTPELLILDEPTLGLDVVAKRAFLEVLIAASQERACTIVYCSHQMEEIERLADRLIILEQGQLRHVSTPDAFCERVSLWVAEFPFVAPGLNELPGVLQVQRVDGLFHVLVMDAPDDFSVQLEALGARQSWQGAVNLDRAVNAFLARHHSMPS